MLVSAEALPLKAKYQPKSLLFRSVESEATTSIILSKYDKKLVVPGESLVWFVTATLVDNPYAQRDREVGLRYISSLRGQICDIATCIHTATHCTSYSSQTSTDKTTYSAKMHIVANSVGCLPLVRVHLPPFAG